MAGHEVVGWGNAFPVLVVVAVDQQMPVAAGVEIEARILHTQVRG
jgi:hypothetical protein